LSDPTSLTVPDAGWYADRNDTNTVRWWDGGQWTEHTRSISPEQNVAQPVSAAAFGFTPVEPNPVASVSPYAAATAPAAVAAAGQAAAGWYPDHADPSIQRWWNGTQWTSHTAPGVALPIPTPTPGSYLGAYTTPVAPAVNTLATRGMIYSLIGLVLNPFLIMSIGGLVNGIRSLRRVPQFAPQNARRGQAIAAIAVGSVATVLSMLVIAVAILIPVIQAQRPHVFDQVGAEQDIMTQLVPDNASQALTRVSCPPDPAMKVGDAFDCTAYLADGETLPVHITIQYDGRTWTYTWRADFTEASGNSNSTGTSTDPGAHPTTVDQLKQLIAHALENDGAAVSSVACPADASVTPGSAFVCNALLVDGSTTAVNVQFPANGGYGLSFTPPTSSGGSSDPGSTSNPDLSHS
jgi:hypothetical protein